MSKTCSYITPITAGTYTNATVTVDLQGVVTAISNGVTQPVIKSVTRSRNAATFWNVNDIMDFPINISDPDGIYNNGTGGTGGTAAFVIPDTGSWLICFNCLFGTTNEVLAVQLNGSDILRLSGPGGADSYNGSIVWPCVVGDLVRVRCISASIASATSAAWSISITRQN